MYQPTSSTCGGQVFRIVSTLAETLPGIVSLFPSYASNTFAALKPLFRSAKVFNSTIVPGAGHGLDFGYSHTEAYQSIIRFLKEEGQKIKRMRGYFGSLHIVAEEF